MKSRESLKTPVSTRTQPYSGAIKGGAVDQAFSRVIADTGNEALAAEKIGVLLEEYQKEHGRKEKKLSKEREIKSSSEMDKEFKFRSWVDGSISQKLKSEAGIVKIFKEVSLKKEFQDLLDYKIFTLEGQNDEQVKRFLFNMVKDLEEKSEISLGSQRDNFLENLSNEIIKEIGFHENTIEEPSMDLYSRDKDDFKNRVFFYLKRKIVIEKLREILTILLQHDIV